MTDHEHNSTSAGNTGKTPEKAKAPKDPGTALITTGKTPEAAKASKNSGNAPAGSGKAPEKAKASGTTPKTNGRVTDKTKAPAKASGNASANAGKAPAANATKASNTPVNSGKVQDKAKTSKAPAAAFTKASKAPEPVKASKVSPSVPGNPGKTPEAKKPNAAAPVSSGKGTVVSKASVVSSAAPANAGKTADTKTAKASGTASASTDKVSQETRTSRDSSSGYTPVRNTTPAKPPKSGKSGLLIGILIAAVVVIILGIVLYNKFFVPKEIHVSETSLQLEVNDVAKLTYTVLPQSADNLEVAWASSDPGVATVDEFGVVTAVSGGQCIIAVATGNNKTDTCVVTVNDLKQVQKESLETIVKYVDSQETTAASPKTGAETSADSQVTNANSEDASADSQAANADSKGTSADSQAATTDSQGTAAGDEYRLLGVKDIDDAHSFLIGAEGEDLILVYRTVEELEDLGVDAQYTTYVRMKPENTDTADVVQENNLVLYGFPSQRRA